MILSHADFQKIRKQKGVRSLNDGSQTDAFSSKSDITIYVGQRGVGKTTLMLYRVLPRIHIPQYNCAFFRKEVKDANGVGGIVDASKEVFSRFGTFRSSVQSLDWTFESGAKAVFMNYSAPIVEFQEAIQGKEYTDAVIDEITQIGENWFNAIFSNLRNTVGMDTHILGTCNADPKSWIKHLIAWWLDPETGYHIPERDGKTRYFFQHGDTILDSVWGDTREEVYQKAKQWIDAEWRDEMGKYGGTKLDFVLSLTVYEGKTYENDRLMQSGGVKYLAKLQKGNREMKNRYARACWRKLDTGDALVSESDMSRFFHNSMQTTGTKYASMDVCGKGTDKAVLWIWDGLHIINCYMTNSMDAKSLREWTTRHLNLERVPVTNFIYDAVGVGYALSGYFDGAVEFISNAKPTEESSIKTVDRRVVNLYANAKSQLIGIFLEILKDFNGSGECGISINPELLDRMYFGEPLRDHLLKEAKGIRWRDDKDGIKQCINKKETIKLLGHSADIMMSLIYRMWLSVGKKAFVPMSDNNLSNFQNFFLNY